MQLCLPLGKKTNSEASCREFRGVVGGGEGWAVGRGYSDRLHTKVPPNSFVYRFSYPCHIPSIDK